MDTTLCNWSIKTDIIRKSNMQIELKRIGNPFHFKATNEEGNSVEMDAAAGIGGTGKGVRPMELFIMGLAGCTGVDVVMILEKQQQVIHDFEIKINAGRKKTGEISLFSEIHIEYLLKGEVDEQKLKRAIDLSLTKYCSAAATLEKTATISYSYRIES